MIVRAAFFLSLLVAAAADARGAPVASEIEAPGPEGPLRGTMLAAAPAARPVALIIPGSGPTDRNGNGPAGLAASSYRLLAQGLAQRGVSSVRIDKRGMFGSGGAIADANAVTIRDYSADVHSWVRAIRARTGAGCVWVIGHSEGVLVALSAAQRGDGICGLVLVAGAGRPIGDVLREQLRGSPAVAPVLSEALAAIERIESGQRVDPATLSPALMPLFAPQVQNYLIDLLSHDPADLIARVTVPVLIVQGLRDIQTSEQDARRLAAANSRARLVLLPDVNHVLKVVATDDRADNIRTYTDPSLPLAPGIAEVIAQFIVSAGGGERHP